MSTTQTETTHPQDANEGMPVLQCGVDHAGVMKADKVNAGGKAETAKTGGKAERIERTKKTVGGKQKRSKDRETGKASAKVKKAPKTMPSHKEAVDSEGIFWATERISERGKDLLRTIGKYFTDERIEAVLIPFVEDDCGSSVCNGNRNEDSDKAVKGGTKSTKVKLRVIDWLVTNWSKKKNEVIISNDPDYPSTNIHDDYNSMLKHYGRRYFDVFRRRTRLYFCHRGKTYETTVAQLNLMHWLDKTKILHYAKKNWEAIAQDMSSTIKANQIAKRKAKQEDGKGPKRKALSKPPARSCHIYTAPRVVKFGK